MKEKLTLARDYLISQLECGEWQGGQKIPGTLKLTRETGISLAIMQMALLSLARDGILETRARSGTYVRPDWNRRILPGSFASFRPAVWNRIAREYAAEQIPELQVYDTFPQGMFEVRTTIALKQYHDEYLGLSGLLREVCPDDSAFFSAPFEGFRGRNGELYGIPLIFSPRVICFNPELLAVNGCAEPRPGWSWAEFLEMIGKLRQTLPPERVLNWGIQPIWLSFFYRAGGRIMENGEVVLDDERSMQAIYEVARLYHTLGVDGLHPAGGPYDEHFYRGENAFMIAARQDINWQMKMGWKSVPLPVMPSGEDVTVQATDLLCIRKTSGDIQLAKQVIETFLSPAIQDHLGAMKYGIPIRKNSAINSFDPGTPRDMLFLAEMPKVAADFTFDSPEITGMLVNGFHRIWLGQAEPRATAREIAAAIRTILKYRMPVLM